METFSLFSLIAAMLGQPVGSQANIDIPEPVQLTHSIIGSWQCYAKNDMTEFDSVETFTADGKYLSNGKMQYTPTPFIDHPTITYDLSGIANWELVGDQLYNHGLKIQAENLTHPEFDDIFNPNDVNKGKST